MHYSSQRPPFSFKILYGMDDIINIVSHRKHSSPEKFVNSPPEGIINSPPEGIVNSPREEIVNSPPEEIINSPPKGIVNSPHKERVIVISLDSSSYLESTYGPSSFDFSSDNSCGEIV
nr:hypothetical protein [Tanacetum cinerariifolium]